MTGVRQWWTRGGVLTAGDVGGRQCQTRTQSTQGQSHTEDGGTAAAVVVKAAQAGWLGGVATLSHSSAHVEDSVTCSFTGSTL